jgi:polar amino acid transport system substrate-binding protein
MIMKRKIVSIMLITAMAAALLAGCGKKSNTLIVGTEAGFAPYEYMKGNEVVGIDMDISQAIADSMGKKLKIKNMDFKGALLAVQKGTIDFVAAGVSIDPDREKVMDFSIPYVNSTEVVVVNKADPAVAKAGLGAFVGGVCRLDGNLGEGWRRGRRSGHRHVHSHAGHRRHSWSPVACDRAEDWGRSR